MLRLRFIPLLALSFLLVGCGQVFVGFVSNPGNPMSVSGTINSVQLGFITSQGTTVTFTAVAFINASSATTINFCGDQRNQFPISRFAQANFNTGVNCSTLIVVVVQGQEARDGSTGALIHCRKRILTTEVTGDHGGPRESRGPIERGI